MVDLTWVKDIKVVEVDDDDALKALFDNPGWHLLLVTGGLYTPVQCVFGWGDKPVMFDKRKEDLDAWMRKNINPEGA